MSTVKATHIQHPSAASPNFTLSSDGSVSGGAGLGGLVHIATESFTAVSSVSFDDVFSADYDNYRIFASLASTGNYSIKYQLRSSGSDNTDSTYQQQRFGANNSTILTNQSTNSAPDLANVGASTSMVVCDIFGPFIAGVTGLVSSGNYNTGSIVHAMNYYGSHQTISSFDGIKFYPSSSTITGSISIYGYAKS